MDSTERRNRLRQTLNSVLGLELLSTPGSDQSKTTRTTPRSSRAMKTRNWDRSEVILHLRDDIWRYVTQALEQYRAGIGSSGEELLLRAGALLQMSAAEVRYSRNSTSSW